MCACRNDLVVCLGVWWNGTVEVPVAQEYDLEYSIFVVHSCMYSTTPSQCPIVYTLRHSRNRPFYYIFWGSSSKYNIWYCKLKLLTHHLASRYSTNNSLFGNGTESTPFPMYNSDSIYGVQNV